MTRTATREPVPPRAWRMLALGVGAQTAGSVLVSTPAYLIPLLHLHRGLPLARAGLLAAAPTFGTVLMLVAWGALADRYGERWVIVGGLAIAAASAALGSIVHGYVPLGACLLLGGAGSASTSAASGRVVVGWFPRSRRGFAMGIRQMAQPLGVAVAAIAVPSLASRFGIGAPLVLAAVLTGTLAVLCAVGIVNPPRPPRSAEAADAGPTNPYRGDRFLLRIHVVSLLLVVPQFTLSTFGLIWLVSSLHWHTAAAGAVIAASQLVGAFGRILVGSVSDRVGSRVRVLRWVAVSGVATMGLTAASGALGWSAAAAVIVILATTVSVADNGLAFTSVAEAAGPTWSGKALGIQNTGQFLAASAVAPGIGAVIAALGFPVAFALVAITPLLSIPLVPSADRHRG